MHEKNKQKTDAPSRKQKLVHFLSHEISLVTISILIISLLIGGLIYYELHSSRVYIEKAEINAPIISLKPEAPGILQKVFVKEGEFVSINTIVAQVDDKTIRTKTSGIITSVKNVPGQFVTAQDSIVQMINPEDMRLVGHLEENKGLKDVMEGQKVLFTVDAFNSKEYEGTVETVSPTSRDSDVVFTISDKREQKIFDIKAKFDVSSYPELKNGMSARMWVYTS